MISMPFLLRRLRICMPGVSKLYLPKISLDSCNTCEFRGVLARSFGYVLSNYLMIVSFLHCTSISNRFGCGLGIGLMANEVTYILK